MNKTNRITRTYVEALDVRVRCEFTRFGELRNSKGESCVKYGHQLRALETMLRAEFGDRGADLLKTWALASSEGRSNG